QIPAGQPHHEADTRSEVRRRWHEDVKSWVGLTSGACITVSATFVGTDSDGSLLWGVFLGGGMLLLGLLFVLIVRDDERWCFTPRREMRAAHERRDDDRV
ncbi:unnamed protein product, partial [Sphacelaria rigidula]